LFASGIFAVGLFAEGAFPVLRLHLMHHA